jgi:hypothetical protein
MTISPTPWRVVPENGFTVADAAGNTLVLYPGNTVPMCQANARLIAAAPELLAALRALHAAHRGFRISDVWGVLDDEARAAAEAAIAKAEGGAA